ncbi:MAG: PilZ domain-containing protein [Thermodesulfobacteriota bacterium]
MVQSTCPKCQNKFYTESSELGASCPFCGFFFQLADAHSKREQTRATLEKSCDLLKGEARLSGHTVDISRSGIGVALTDSTVIYKGDTLHVVVKEIEIDSSAQVVWVENFSGVQTRVGLRFC